MMPQFIRAVREARPLAFLLENVAGLLTPRHASYTKSVISRLKGLGYTIQARVLDAAAYGVPQHRRRLFVVGVTEGISFEFPAATHGPDAALPYATAGSVLECLVDDERNAAKVRYARKPVLRRSPWAGLLLNGKGRPINLHAPSLTIPATAGGNRTHILDPNGVLLEYHRHLSAGGRPRRGDVPGVRRLTVRESARLQSFPDDFAFLGPSSKRYSQVGNAVPPLLAKAVAKALYKALFKQPLANVTLSPDEGVASYERLACV
jgi:DNA (cytosine-5)-methyltransferase 1